MAFRTNNFNWNVSCLSISLWRIALNTTKPNRLSCSCYGEEVSIKNTLFFWEQTLCHNCPSHQDCQGTQNWFKLKNTLSYFQSSASTNIKVLHPSARYFSSKYNLGIMVNFRSKFLCTQACTSDFISKNQMFFECSCSSFVLMIQIVSFIQALEVLQWTDA